jgi:hypothetical protein
LRRRRFASREYRQGAYGGGTNNREDWKDQAPEVNIFDLESLHALVEVHQRLLEKLTNSFEADESELEHLV